MVTAKQIALLNCDMPFRFMDLPPEIRLRVYGYLFVPRGPIQIKEVEAIVNGMSSRSRPLYYRESETDCHAGVLDKRILGLYKEGRAAQVRCFETESASNILTVSKTIHYEAIEILHRGVTFVFGSETDLIDHFLAKIGPAQQSHLTQIRLAYGFYGYRFLSSMRQLLESATRLAGFILDFESSNLRHLLGYYDAFEAFPRCSLEFRESPVSDPPGSTIPGLYEFVRLCFGKSGEGHNSPEHLQVLGLAGEQGQNSFAPVNLVRSSEQLRQWQNDQECATFMASDLDKALRELLERYKRSKNIF